MYLRDPLSRQMRSFWILGVALAIVVMLLPVTNTRADSEPAMTGLMPSPEGTWVVRVLFEGEFRIQYLQTFTRDGKTTLFLPFGGPINADDTRVACTGEWRRADLQYFDVTTYCLATQEWETAPDRIRMRLKLDQDTRTFTDAPFKYEAFLPDGTQVFSGDGLMSGKRLGIVPLD